MKLVGDGLVKSAALFVTRFLSWAAALVGAIIAGVNAGTSGEPAVSTPDTTTPPQVPAPVPGSGGLVNFFGFSSTQTAAILIALIALARPSYRAAELMGGGGVTAGERGEVDQALVERVRARLEQDGQMIKGTEKNARPATLHRAAQLAVEELMGDGYPITWTSARTRPRATPDTDDPRDLLIGRLAVILGAADGGHHAASYDTMISAARRVANLTEVTASDRRGSNA